MANSQSIDLKLTEDQAGLFDISLKDDDFESVEGLNTAVYVSLFTDGRAPFYNVPDSFRRRGWIGNIGATKIPTSLLWILDQSRLIQSTLNSAKLYVEECLRWMLTQKIAKTIEVEIRRDYREAIIEVLLLGFNDQSNRFFIIWKKTGR